MSLVILSSTQNIKGYLIKEEETVAYQGILFEGVQQIQLRTERTGIWGR